MRALYKGETIMTLAKAVTKRIDELLFKRGWSLYKLAKEACIPLSTLKNLYTNHTKSPTLGIVFKIAEAFCITPAEFLNAKIFASEELEID